MTDRAALKEAISQRDRAKEALSVAEQTSTRAKAQLRQAESQLAAFGDIENEILKHRADLFADYARGGPKPSMDLPPALAAKEQGRDEAKTTANAAKAALINLSGELAKAQSVLAKAELKVTDAANEVLAAEATGHASHLDISWDDLWRSVDALHALQVGCHVKLPVDIVRLLQIWQSQDFRQFPGSRNPVVANFVSHWNKYRDALRQNADATEPDGNEGSNQHAA
jgi:hypothetical protein